MWLLLAALSCSLTIVDPTPTWTHVRAVSGAAQALLLDAAGRSEIINGLAEHLESTDTIVYVEIVGTPDIPLARTKLVSGSSVARFLRISINSRVPWWDRLPLLAHELQHAVEIADADDVRTDDGVRKLYTKIGYAGAGTNQYETAAARDTESKVRSEVARREPR
jgi:hypothetical protein